LRNNVKEKLARDEVVASMTVRLVRQVEIAQIAATAGFDTLYIDVEHASVSLETTSQICIAALAAGIAPFVRVPANTPEYISRVLDGGALGIIAPHIGSAAEAREVVDAAKFPPLGSRSAAGAGLSTARSQWPGPMPRQRCHHGHGPVRERAALARAEEIVAVPGVDMVMIGTNDLLADWGMPEQYEHPRVREAYAQTIAACRKHGKHVGVGGLASRPKLVAEFVQMGARYVSTGTDLAFLLGACAQRARQVRDIVL
jgi:2-keto-3-deoxy-L-rhamnonate aldolase RhmA